MKTVKPLGQQRVAEWQTYFSQVPTAEERKWEGAWTWQGVDMAAENSMPATTTLHQVAPTKRLLRHAVHIEEGEKEILDLSLGKRSKKVDESEGENKLHKLRWSSFVRGLVNDRDTGKKEVWDHMERHRSGVHSLRRKHLTLRLD